MGKSLKAGIDYFAIVFTAGFVLGAIRQLVIAPRIGDRAAVLLELPIILVIAWLACGLIVKRDAIAATPAARLAMGALAFGLLMAAELALAVFALGITPAQHLASFVSAPAAIGLIGQIAFGLMPLLHLLRRP